MLSKQARASRRNGKKSSGPVTNEGKATSSMNAVSHAYDLLTRLQHRRTEDLTPESIDEGNAINEKSTNEPISP